MTKDRTCGTSQFLCWGFYCAYSNNITGRWEDIIVTNVKKIIPDSVENFWYEWRASMKQAEKDMTGDVAVSEQVEMAGWGVEEATEQNKRDASTSSPACSNIFIWREDSKD